MKTPFSIFVAGTISLLALANSAQAVVLVSFAQSGNNVTATLSGSLQLPEIGDRVLDDEPYIFNTAGGSDSLFTILQSPPSYDVYDFGQSFSTGLNQNPDSFSGSVGFGYTFSGFIVEGSSSPGGTVTPTGTWTWNNTTLAGIGLGSLTSTPVIVYQAAASSGDTIQFAAVPEPSSSVLLGLGATALLFTRRRQR